MKTLILGCNGGTDLAYGGGAQVAIAMAHCLEKLSHKVYLLSLTGLDREHLVKAHGFNIGKNVHIRFAIDARTKPKIPYSVALRKVRELNSFLLKIKPDLIIYHDDIPKSFHNIVKQLKIPTVLYIHFSYWVRQRIPWHNIKIVEWSPLEALMNYVSIDYLLENPAEADIVITNSRATKRITEVYVDREDIIVLNPPVRAIKPVHYRKPLLFLHAGRQDRTFLERELLVVIKSLLKKYRNAIVIINRNKSRKLFKLSHKLSRLYAIEKLDARVWSRVLDLVRYYLHFKWFEGYGIATAEATLRGAIPIVYRSPFNGSWTDIAVASPYCSFQTSEEALNNVEELESNPQKRKLISDSLIRKLSTNTIDSFCKKLKNVIRSMA